MVINRNRSILSNFVQNEKLSLHSPLLLIAEKEEKSGLSLKVGKLYSELDELKTHPILYQIYKI